MAAAAFLPHIGLLFDGLYALVAEQGSYSVTGQDATLDWSGAPVGDTPAPLPHLGLLGGIGGNAGVSEQGSYALTGQDVAFLRGLRLISDAGFYTLSGQPAILNISVNQGGYPAPLPHLGLLLQSTVTGYTLTADPGTYSISGSEAVADFEVSAAQGSYGFTGQDAALRKTHILVAEAGSYALAGQDAIFEIGSPARTLTAESGTYAVSGQDAGLYAGRYVGAEHGFFALLGQAANLVYGVATNYSMLAEQGTYSTTGQDAALTFGGYVLQADYGTYAADFKDTVSASTPSGPFHKKFRRKYAMWIGAKKYLGTQEDFEKLVAASFSNSVPDELPRIAVRVDTGAKFDAAASELEKQLEAALRKIQRDAYRRRKEEEEFNFL